MYMYIHKNKHFKEILQNINSSGMLLNDFNFILSTFLMFRDFCFSFSFFYNKHINSLIRKSYTLKSKTSKVAEGRAKVAGSASGAEVWDSASARDTSLMKQIGRRHRKGQGKMITP